MGDPEANGIAAVPSKANRKRPRELDREAYAGRSRIERFFGKIKEFRWVATRCEKRARNYLSEVMLAVTRYLLRSLRGIQTSPQPRCRAEPKRCPR